MQNDPDTIAHLNAVLKNKLTAINQYFLHARILKHQGHLALADQEYKTSIDAMKHSDMLVEHILALGGVPNLQELGSLMIGDTPESMLANDMKHAQASMQAVREAIALCESKGNLISVGLLIKLLSNHQDRIEYIRSQLSQPEHHQKDCA